MSDLDDVALDNEKRQCMNSLHWFSGGEISLVAAAWNNQPYPQWFVDYHDEMHPSDDEVIDCVSALLIQGWKLIDEWQDGRTVYDVSSRYLLSRNLG